jgi:protease PrsW
MYSIQRNNQNFGPYSLENLKKYVEEGKILLSDKLTTQHGQDMTVRELFANQHITVSVQNNGGILAQIKNLGQELIVPNFEFIKSDLMKDNKLIFLAGIGLAPAFLITFTLSSYLTFYAISLYFSVIWALFFHYLFGTKQVENKKVIFLFFLSQLTATILVNVQVIPPLSWLYSMTQSGSFFGRMIGFIFGVGVTEEIIKAVPLLYFLRKAKEPILPQTLVYYGMISGLGFGLLEGVLYQTTTNVDLEYNVAFFMNIARLTTLPFLHSIWAGIAGYFIAFANLYPRNRQGLYVMAIAIPAILHGLYDTFGWSLIGLGVMVFSVFLLVYYLKKSRDYQSKLS